MDKKERHVVKKASASRIQLKQIFYFVKEAIIARLNTLCVDLGIFLEEFLLTGR
jgi:hypothetical protein